MPGDVAEDREVGRTVADPAGERVEQVDEGGLALAVHR